MAKRRGSRAAQMMLGSFAAVGAELPDRFVVLEWAREWRTANGAICSDHGMEAIGLDHLPRIAARVKKLEAEGVTVTATFMERGDLMTDGERHAIEAAIFGER